MLTRTSASYDVNADKHLSLIVILLFISFLFPIVFNIGPIKILPYRLVLLLASAPILYKFFSMTKKHFVDYLVLLYCFWCSLCIVIGFGLVSSLESITIFWVETLIPYLMARVYICNEQNFINFAKFIFVIIFILVPIGLFENLTANSLPILVLGKVFTTIPYIDHEVRLGLDRAQGPFDHPILLGVFSFTFFSIVFYFSAPEKKLFTRSIKAAFVFLAGFSSLSSGPLAGLAVQIGLIAWGSIFRSLPGKWVILMAGLATMYTLISLVANSTPIEIAFRYLTFNSNTAWARINIWNYGYASMFNYPIFGHGPNEWTRPAWLGASIDMYWLAVGVRYGFPGFFLNLLILFTAVVAVSRGDNKSHILNMCSKAYLFSLIGLLVAGWSVHFWNATYVNYMFVLGIGIWIINAQNNAEPAEVLDQSSSGLGSRTRKRNNRYGTNRSSGRVNAPRPVSKRKRH